MGKVQLDLSDVSRNAFALLGAFSRAARDQDWDGSAIKAVLDEASAGDYDHLLQTLMRHVEDTLDTDAGDE